MARAEDEAFRVNLQLFADIHETRDGLAPIVEAGAACECELEYYEYAVDPDRLFIAGQQRSHTGQYLRRLRRLASHVRRGKGDADELPEDDD